MNAERITRPPNTPKPMSRLVDNDDGEGLIEGSIRVGIAVGLSVGFVEGFAEGSNEGLANEGLTVGQDDGSD